MIAITKFNFNSFGEQCYLVWSDCGDGRAVLIDPGFDTERDYDIVKHTLNGKGLKLAAILLTHAHPDHVYGVGRLCRDYGLQVYMHSGEKVTVDALPMLCREIGHIVPDSFLANVKLVSDNQILSFGGLQFLAISTPGHTAGGLSWLCREVAQEVTGATSAEAAKEATGAIPTASGALDSEPVQLDSDPSQLYAQGWKVLFCGDTLFAGCIGRSDLPGGDYDLLMQSIMTRLITLDGRTDVLPGHGKASTIADEGMKNPFLQPFNEPDFDF